MATTYCLRSVLLKYFYLSFGNFMPCILIIFIPYHFVFFKYCTIHSDRTRREERLREMNLLMRRNFKAGAAMSGGQQSWAEHRMGPLEPERRKQRLAGTCVQGSLSLRVDTSQHRYRIKHLSSGKSHFWA